MISNTVDTHTQSYSFLFTFSESFKNENKCVYLWKLAMLFRHISIFLTDLQTYLYYDFHGVFLFTVISSKNHDLFL